VATGVSGNPENLDDLLQGGFESGKTYLVAGGAGTGKTLFGLQFLLQGIKNGEPGIYIPLHERPERLIQDAKRFGWKLDQHVRESKLLVLPRHSFATKTDPNDAINSFIDELQKRSRQVNARRLVIDPIEALFTGYIPEMWCLRWFAKRPSSSE
jgi:circadian clock protein KaiC